VIELSSLNWRGAARSPRVLIGGAIVLALVACALFAPWIAPRDPEDQNLVAALLPPAWSEGADRAYPLGTDSLGRCVLSRLIYGARVALYVALAASFGAMPCLTRSMANSQIRIAFFADRPTRVTRPTWK